MRNFCNSHGIGTIFSKDNDEIDQETETEDEE